MTSDVAETSVERRELLRRAFWGGIGVAGASVVVAAPALTGLGDQAEAQSRRRFAVDVACLGDTFRFIPVPGNHPEDLRGAPFSVEGNIYKAGTIKGVGFDPSSKAPTGTWVCRGWLMIAPGRETPSVITTQEYFLGSPISEGVPFPRNQLVSSGLEGDGSPPPHRSVIGGAGKYFAARGAVIQHGLGTNTTSLWLGGALGPAPNFRFEFVLMR